MVAFHSGIGDAAPPQVDVRHLARREDAQHAAALQPAQALLQRLHVQLGRDVAREGIHEDHGVVQVGHRLQDEVGHQFHVRPDGSQQRPQDDAFDAAERMVGHHDQAAVTRDAGQVLLPDRQLDVHHVQHLVQEVPVVRAARRLVVDLVDGVDRQHLLHRAPHDGEHLLAQRVLEEGAQVDQGLGRIWCHAIPTRSDSG
jgi:hypothetical protein